MSINKDKLIVANTGSDTLTVIDLKDDYSLETFKLWEMLNSSGIQNLNSSSAIGPYTLAAGNEKNIIYSVNSYDNSVFKINIKDMVIEEVIYIGRSPSHVEIIDGLIFVTNTDSNSVSVIDEENFVILENITVGEKPYDIKADFEEKRVFVANSNEYSISVIYLENNKIEKIRLDSNPLHFFLNSKLLYILSSQVNGMVKSSVSILDLSNNELIKKVYIEGVLVDMTPIDKKDEIFVTNAEDGYLYKIDLIRGKIIDKYHLGGMPSKLLWDGNKLLYIVNSLKNYISLFDCSKGKIMKNIKVGIEPNGLIFL
ncbi:YncE family protein [Thermohalobacter berrensis]|uniref:YncE family protein n=1 Tax=Thermohalobacter berrensis TaxID=99594 RepID=A0A419T2Z6_9FIRM|nr:YncE family protein [Thermohalobacter berrensis]RKD31803.1 hypothetical protein BET03_12035 [Thermohalobacter berrensis]